MTWKLYALLSGGAFVATYLVSGSGTLTPAQRSAAPAAARPAPPSTAEADIQVLADRLQARVRAEVGYHEPTRNPFAFGALRRVEASKVIAQKAPEPAPVVVATPLPPVGLTGIATDTVDGVVQRTAIFSSSAGVVLAREGETVAGSYRVVEISESTVTLEAAADGSRHRLSLTRR